MTSKIEAMKKEPITVTIEALYEMLEDLPEEIYVKTSASGQFYELEYLTRHYSRSEAKLYALGLSGLIDLNSDAEGDALMMSPSSIVTVYAGDIKPVRVFNGAKINHDEMLGRVVGYDKWASHVCLDCGGAHGVMLHTKDSQGKLRQYELCFSCFGISPFYAVYEPDKPISEDAPISP